MFVNTYNYEIYKDYINNVFSDSIFLSLVETSTNLVTTSYSNEKIKQQSKLYSFSGEISEETKNYCFDLLQELFTNFNEIEDGDESTQSLEFNPKEFFFHLDNTKGSEFLVRFFYLIGFTVYTSNIEEPIKDILETLDFLRITQDFSLVDDKKLENYINNGDTFKSLESVDISDYPEHLLTEFVVFKGKHYYKEDIIKMIDASSQLVSSIDEQDIEEPDNDTNNTPQTRRKIRLAK